MAHAALKVIRPVLSLTSRLAPRLAGKLAFRLFCTPIGHAPVKAGNPRIRAAQALFARAAMRNVPYGAGYVRAYRFEPSSPPREAVLLLHGWTGQALFMSGFVEPLLAAGYRVIAVDLPAHGGSSGRQLTFPLAMAAVSAVLRDEMPLAGIVGHSFGGAIGAALVAGGVECYPPIPARRLVTLAAPRAMQGYGQQFSRSLGLSAQGHRVFEDQVQAIAGRPMASFSNVEYLRRTQIPTLAMHAPEDPEIPFSDAEALATAGEHVTLRAMPGLGHRRILASAEVQRAAAAFIAGG